MKACQIHCVQGTRYSAIRGVANSVFQIYSAPTRMTCVSMANAEGAHLQISALGLADWSANSATQQRMSVSQSYELLLFELKRYNYIILSLYL
jgi:hypothetical protein